MSNPLPSQERLRELYDYSAITGQLYHKSNSRRAKKGKEVGSVSRGYLNTKVDGISYRVPRLIWMWVTGEDPGELTIELEHRQRDNNAWHNLSLIPKSQQPINRQCVIDSPYPLHVYYCKDKNRFRVTKKHKHFGSFKTLEEASRKAKEIEDL